jgi:tetratricopeptide (TPR) repeat protein
MNEQNWAQALKYLESATRIRRLQPDFNLAMGDCYRHVGKLKEAIFHFTLVVQHRPRSSSGWESLINCLYQAEHFEEAALQVGLAELKTGDKPIFQYYRAAVLFEMGKPKEALLQLEAALQRAPKLLKKFIEINPVILQNQAVVDLIATIKRKRTG